MIPNATERNAPTDVPPGGSPLVTIIVPCRNEEGYIGPCLDSILESDYPRDRLEVLVTDGMSDDRTREILHGYTARHPWIRVLDNPRRITPVGLNLAIRASRGAILVRMDAHVIYPRNYVTRLVAALDEFGADNVGAVIRTLPANQTVMGKAIAIGMSHPFGVGTSYFRIGTDQPRWVDTIAFFCVRRSTFDRVGMFDEELIRHQDGEFNARLIKSGGRILLIPDVVSYYYARATLHQVGRMFYQYGYFKPLVAKKLGRFMTVRQLIPPGFVLGLLVTGVAALLWKPALLLFGLVAGSYATVVLGSAVQSAIKEGPAVGAALAAVLPVIHVSYGVGFWRRVVELLLPSRRASAERAAELPLSR
jgi:glycosyltransferase involved in cell wall biosynthesis